MNAYSVDLRVRIVHYVDSGQAIDEVAARFAVSERTVRRYLKQRREVGHLEPKRRPGARPKLGEAQVGALRQNLHDEPALTLAERCAWLEQATGVSLSVPTMFRWVRRLRYSRNNAPSAPSSATSVSAGRS